MKRLAYLALCGLFGLANLGAGSAAETARVQARVFVQDEASGKLHWADMARSTNPDHPAPQPVNLGEIEGFPQLDPEYQSLVQMRASGKYLLVAVRDNDDGDFVS